MEQVILFDFIWVDWFAKNSKIHGFMGKETKSETRNEETNNHQDVLDFLNAWIDWIEIRSGKPISKIVEDCATTKNPKNPKTDLETH